MSHRLFLLFSLLLFNLILYVIVFDAHTYYQPQVVIVPHHDLVKTERQAVLKEVARRRPLTQTIILLSPDHFNPNQRLITSSNENFTTAQGMLYFDSKIGAYLAPLVINNPTAVKNDHGIFALLADIKTNFPKAKIVPILIGQALTSKDLKSVSETINQTCLSDCLLLASVDFSHYLPAGLANVHDAFSLKTLSNLNLQEVMGLEVDSPQSLYLALAHAPARFVLKKHTNSGEMLQNYDIETTSHVMGWYQRGQLLPVNSQTFLFARDLSRATNQKTLGERFFYGTDVTNTNLTKPQSPAPNLQINPVSSSITTLKYQDEILTINLASDLAVAGTISPAGDWQLVLLPLSHQGILRGPLKQDTFNRLLPSIPLPFSFNPSTGTINYSATLK